MISIKKSISFIESYFTNRKQSSKIGDSFSKYQRIITEVPQGSIKRFLSKKYIENY